MRKKLTFAIKTSLPKKNYGNKVDKKLQSVINHEKINAIARTVCWQQRKRNLSAMHLLGLLLGGQTNYQRSLTEMSQDLLDEGVVISKQSLDERLNEKASNSLI